MRVPKLLPSILLLACAGPLAGSDTPAMPSWMTPYPGASERTGTQATRVWSSYLAKASLAEVVEYYHGLFDGAGLTFHPVANALTTTIRGAAPECSLEIVIQGLGARTSVQVTCSAWASQSEHLQAQAKFDRPVYPQPRVPGPAGTPPLVWPDWLTTCEPDAAPEIQKGVDQFKLRFLKVEFTSLQDRDAIEEFYADLLNAHDYPVWVRSSKLTPRDKTAVVEGRHFFGGKPGPRFDIHVQLTPVNGAIQVELRMTAHPN
ncbi:MAG: hypothetical protein ACLQU1_28945 [Bryobacteraceae bacterium]